MKWVAALLLIVNVAAYLWVGGRHAGVDQPAVAGALEINKEGMLLLSEMPASDKTAVQPSAAEDARPLSQPSGQIGQSGQASQFDDAASRCYRIGPFTKEADWQAAKRWMAMHGFTYRAARSASREMRAIRVYLGPFASQDAANLAARRLKEKAIDHFIDSRNPAGVRVSLGYFTQEALAVKFIGYLLSRGVEANSLAEYRAMKPFHWVEAAIAATSAAAISTRRWPGDGARASEIHCRKLSPAVESGG